MPIIFNTVDNMIDILIARAKDVGQVGGLIPHLVDGGVSILQYADVTFIFMEHMEKMVNIKLVLYIFEELSGLNTKLHKELNLLLLWSG